MEDMEKLRNQMAGKSIVQGFLAGVCAYLSWRFLVNSVRYMALVEVADAVLSKDSE